MVLFVEGQLAAAVCLVGGGRGRCTRLPTLVDDLGRGGEKHLPSTAADRRAEVHVLQIHEIALVQQAHFLRGITANEQARTRYPVHVTFTPGQRFRGARHELLAQLRDRRNHASPGQLGMAAGVYEPRTNDADVRPAIDRTDERVDGPGSHRRVGVQQQDERSGRLADAEIVRARKAQILAGIDDANARPSRPDRACGPVRRGVVHDEELVIDLRPLPDKRTQARVDVSGGVVGDDDDGEPRHIHHHRAADPSGPRVPVSTSTRSTPRAHSVHEYPRTTLSAASRIRARSAALKSSDSNACSMRAGSARFTYSAASRQISRATGVSSSSTGTPVASASSGVSPKPSYSERNANAAL